MTDTMKTANIAGAAASKLDAHYRQQLSALVDGELATDEARFMLRRIEHDAELSGCHERWQVLGDVLRGNACAPAPADFSERVRLALTADIRDNGVLTMAPAAAGRGGWKRWTGGAAIAASVAMVAMFIARQQLPETHAPDTVIAATAQVPALPVQPAAPVTGEAGLAAAAVPAVAAAVIRRQEQVRRGSATRTQQAARGVAARQQEPQRALAVTLPAAAPSPAAAIKADPFTHVAGALPARPWPRSSAAPAAISQGVFNASVPVREPQAAFYPFEPRLPVQESESPPLRGLLPRQ